MISQLDVRQKIKEIEAIDSHEEQLYKLVHIYLEMLPGLDFCNFFRYSYLGFQAEGIIRLSSKGLESIRDVRDDVRSFPIIHSSLLSREAKYYYGVDLHLKQSSSKFLSHFNALLVTPICYGSVALGYLISTSLDDLKIDDKSLSSLTFFGQLVGKIIMSNSNVKETSLLSNRELEVMRRISWGESTKEMSDSMNISEFTVKQYVKSGIKKLGAQNRTQAIAELFRLGIIS